MATTLPPIPPPSNPFEEAVKEILEIFIGLRGTRNSEGEYPDRRPSARELLDLLSGDINFTNAIISGAVPQHTILLDKQIDTGVITINESLDGDGDLYIITVESE
jgi:hypothetical protein